MNALNSAGSAMAVPAAEKPRALGRPLKRRPVPADFAEIAEGKTDNWLRKRYRCSQGAVARWRSELGIAETRKHRPRRQPAATRPCPPHLREMAAKLHKVALCRHYSAGLPVLNRWLEELRIEPAKPPLVGTAAGTPIPADFTEVAPRMTIAALGRHYNCTKEPVERWLKMTGIRPAKHQINRPGFLNQRGAPAPAATDGTVASAAAQHLRRDRAVYRCDILPHREREHLPDHGKGMWVIAGKGAVPAEELVEFARSKGFDPRAWARL